MPTLSCKCSIIDSHRSEKTLKSNLELVSKRASIYIHGNFLNTTAMQQRMFSQVVEAIKALSAPMRIALKWALTSMYSEMANAESLMLEDHIASTASRRVCCRR